jgi:KaiC/GvpD/RAD55 family RecA-like ATPase
VGLLPETTRSEGAHPTDATTLLERNVAGGSSASANQPSTPAGEPRISTGNPGLDSMLEGGLIARRPYLLVGPAGSGKTTLALQFLCEGIRRGERSLLITLEEPPNECRFNHRGFGPEFERVDVFDAIPDVMHYERVPFKDISQVRSVMPFRLVPFVIRRTPELTGVEVTITALEQMLRSEVARRGYTRVVIDSLTALQYFCMKGFDEVAGAQTFLRFLSDLQVTTLLTVESPLEDVDTVERILARGEIRLFRWEINGATVRAIGVEKFRGSSHDVRLHPYQIGPTGLDVDVAVTISRRGARRPRRAGLPN